jgi:two-component system NtrC family response regulator
MRTEREMIDRALSHSNGSLAGAARLLGVSRPTLYGLLDSHGLGQARTPTAEVVAETRDEA